MIYTNNFYELEEAAIIYNQLKADSFEVAFATDNIELVMFLSQQKMLVVKVGTYFPDFVISNVKLDGYEGKSLSFKKALGVMVK